MSKIVYYKQCKLQLKKADGTILHDVAWVPSKFAIQDKFLEIKKNDKWENGWQVTFVGEDQISQEEVAKRQTYSRKHRIGSDI